MSSLPFLLRHEDHNNAEIEWQWRLDTAVEGSEIHYSMKGSPVERVRVLFQRLSAYIRLSIGLLLSPVRHALHDRLTTGEDILE